MKWRMPEMCADCPFADRGPGRELRRYLRPGRWRQILKDLRNDRHFVCHKTTAETGDGTNLLCAGAIAWQEKRGLSSQWRRVAQRLEEWRNSRREAL